MVKLLILLVERISIEDPFMDLTQVMSVTIFFKEKESHRSRKKFPLSFFLFKVSIFKSPRINKLHFRVH